jgi:hypothetical protein
MQDGCGTADPGWRFAYRARMLKQIRSVRNNIVSKIEFSRWKDTPWTDERW